MELELKQNDGEWEAVGELELLSLTQAEASQSAGSLSFSYEPELDGAYRFNASDTIQLRARDTSADAWTRIFSGSIPSSPERAFGLGKATDSVSVLDAWETLSRVTYQVEQFTAASYNKSHIILFRNSDGDRISAGTQAKGILDYAISQGVAIQYAATDLAAMAVEPPADEQSDLSCSEALIKCMRWQSNTFTRFDYSTTPPTLRFLTEAAEQTLSINLSEAMASGGGMRIQRNDNKALRGVIINYEIENQIIDGTTQEVRTDSFGETTGENVLVHTVSIDGSFVQNNETSIDVACASWPTDWATDLDFVKDVFPGNDNYFASIGDAGSSGSTGPNYVTAGYQPGYGVTVNAVDVWWDVLEKWQWKGVNPDSSDDWGDRYKTDYSGIWAWRTIRYSASYLFTSSVSGNYTQSTPVVISGETIPGGVAELVYSARRWPLHSGIIPREITTVSALATPQHNVSLLGSLAEYETMRAPVQRVVRNLMTDTEQITFGYPAQAGVSDFVDMLRANRTVNRPLRRTWKT